MERNKLTVSQLNHYIKCVFDDELILKNIAVYGEIYEKSASGGNLYITLKDENSILHCVHFGAYEVAAEVGDEVLVVGSVAYYSKGNRVSFHIKELSPYGEGAIKKNLAALKEKLRRDGLFDNRPALPNFVRSLAIVTSETGAVIHDFMGILKKRCRYVDVTIYPVRVQGEGAEAEIAGALAEADKEKFDIIVLARGGGSESDLAVFNTEVAARQVGETKTPVISAVGHETDYTLCDFCAAFRAGTPSIAGETVCRINEAFVSRFYSALRSMTSAISGITATETAKVYRAVRALSDHAKAELTRALSRSMDLSIRLKSAATRLASKESAACRAAYLRLNAAADKLYERDRERFMSAAARLNGASPFGIIEKGYAKVYAKGGAVGSAADIMAGDNLDIYMRDGSVRAVATEVKLAKKETK